MPTLILLRQFKHIMSCPVHSGYYHVSPHSSHPQTKQTQVSRSFLTSHVFWTSNNSCCSPLDSCQLVQTFLELLSALSWTQYPRRGFIHMAKKNYFPYLIQHTPIYRARTRIPFLQQDKSADSHSNSLLQIRCLLTCSTPCVCPLDYSYQGIAFTFPHIFLLTGAFFLTPELKKKNNF